MITVADIRRLCPKAREDIIAPIVAVMPAELTAYGVTTAPRFDHFIAQAAHECMGFTTLQELGGAAYFEQHYGPGTPAGRSLGNTQPGDGARFHGRGIFQLTGRKNYIAYGTKLGLDLVGNPDLAAEPATSLKIALEFWKANGLNGLADADNIAGITRRINGPGMKGLAERTALLAKAKTIWPWDGPFSLMAPAADAAPAAPPLPVEPAPPPEPEAIDLPPIATDAPPPLTQSKTLWGTITGSLSSGGFGYTLSTVFQNPNAPWILGVAGGLLVVAGVAVAIVFRERIAKRIELGI